MNWGPQGYSGFLFTRALRSWRETNIFKFNQDDALQVDIANPHGAFRFTKRDGKWIAARSKPHGAAPWPRFDPNSIALLLRDFQSLAPTTSATG